MTDLERALASPATVFATPEDVVAAADLDKDQKCRVLQRWAFDLRELMVATDENMEPAADSGKAADLVTRVDGLLRDLDAK